MSLTESNPVAGNRHGVIYIKMKVQRQRSHIMVEGRKTKTTIPMCYYY